MASVGASVTDPGSPDSCCLAKGTLDDRLASHVLYLESRLAACASDRIPALWADCLEPPAR